MPSYTLIRQETLEHRASACLLSFLDNISSSPLFSSFLIACAQRYGLQELPFSRHTHFSAAWAHGPCHRLDGVLCWLFSLSRSLLSYGFEVLTGCTAGRSWRLPPRGNRQAPQVKGSMPTFQMPDASLVSSGHLHI